MARQSHYRWSPANVQSPLGLVAPTLMMNPNDPQSGEIPVSELYRGGKDPRLIGRHRAKHLGKRAGIDDWHQQRDIQRAQRRLQRELEDVPEFSDDDMDQFEALEDEGAEAHYSGGVGLFGSKKRKAKRAAAARGGEDESEGFVVIGNIYEGY